MDFIDLARNRYSCRKYDSRKPEPEKLNLVLEAGRIAPSAVNFQPWHFFVISDKQWLKRIHEVYHREWFRTAPCVIILAGDHSQSWKRSDGKDHCDIDVAIACDHMTLQAAELGLATCWICNFDKKKTIKTLDMPGNLEPVVLIPLGYPLDEVDAGRHSEKRKALDEIVTYF